MQAIVFMLTAVIVGVLVYKVMWGYIQMPTLLNLPGAILAGAAVISLSGWLSFDLWDSRGIPAPNVPWYHWVLFAGMAIVWYGVCTAGIKAWRMGAQTATTIETRK